MIVIERQYSIFVVVVVLEINSEQVVEKVSRNGNGKDDEFDEYQG
jgi:hypothetical protein